MRHGSVHHRQNRRVDVNNKQLKFCLWVNDATRNTSSVRIIPVELHGNQFEVYNKIARNYSYSFLFETLESAKIKNAISIIGFDPKIIFKGYKDRVEITQDGAATQVIKTTKPFAELKKILKKSDNHAYRYLGGAVGIVNYDAIRLVEDIEDSHGVKYPLMEFGIYDDGILYDNTKGKAFYFYHDEYRFDKLKFDKGEFRDFHSSDVTPSISKEEFFKVVDKAKKYIYEGDIFQVVLSIKFTFQTHGDNLKLYKALRKLNPSPYMYYLKHDKKNVIGTSPEMLVRITDDIVETFPIAGTRKITDDQIKNAQRSEELLNDEKEIAEHTMLLDLGRNDIGKVCKPGSVKVESLMKIKQFSHVQHMVSHVTGKIDSDNDMFDAFQAIFPAGTVSGAPKVRAMEIIDELETRTREAYAGGVGYFAYNGYCDFTINIRSIFIDGEEGFIQAGAGIVSDSTAEDEFKEIAHKSGAMIQALKEASD